MLKLSFTITLVVLSAFGFAQSPHGAGFKTECADCHTSKNWKVDPKKMTFDHNTTAFKLTGQHEFVDCKSCHQTLVFQAAKTECISCHTDMHQNTLGPDCARCHDTKSWIIENTLQMHQMSRFPLLGNHAVLDCAACHKSATNFRFEPLGIDCYDCHKADYVATTSPSHVKSAFPTNCLQCHDSRAVSWNTSTFNHDIFPLTGGHNIACTQCHTNGTFVKISSECISCHQATYNSAQTPSHVAAGISVDCQSCHTTNAWKPSSFKHSTTGFELTGSHSTIVQCSACHQGSTSNASSDCNSCHQANYANAQTPNHSKAGIPVDCKTCHTTTAWQPSTFNHTTTGFELTGSHATIVQCADCHIGNLTSAQPDCYSCHQANFNSAKGHVESKFPTDCTLCHNTTDWLQTSFDHSKTNFPLTGAHTTVECAQCHTVGYVGTPSDCNSCHQTNYTNAQNPNHVKAGIPVDCSTCHTTTAWQPSSFNHNTTAFPLTGSHASIVQCSDCHIGSTTNTSTECYSCHQTQFTGAKDHVASNFPHDCTLCHNTTDWLQTTFDHSTSNFPLTGAHKTVSCAQCHASGYAGTPTDCNSCHQTNYTNVQNPNHVKAGIPVDCSTCHTTTAWQPSSFNHNTTAFPLTGSHASIVQCSDCHIGSTTNTSTECYSCHQTQFTGAKDHVASNFPHDCTLCHNTTDWLQTSFDHSKTNFPLTGAHQTVECAQCHTSGYVGTPTDCNSCHQANYTNAQTPNHTKAGLPVDCSSCHTTTAWQPSTFDHNTTAFPLTGSHASIVQCSDCHLGSTTNTSTDCYSCHQAQYTGAKDHVASNFPHDCTICHSTTNWLDVTFDHSKTNFPLTGAHTTVDCTLCHTSGYVGTSTACQSCHQSNYDQTTNPNHKTLSLPVTCGDCHTTDPNWQPASFPIHNNYFVLDGAHASIANNCSQCHNGVYNNTTPNTCYGCHATDYNNTTNPSHSAAQFPTDCKTCHTTTAWVPSTFDHTSYFPISSGNHNLSCNTCHTTPTNYTIFTCVTSSCHGSAHHQDQGSAGCYSCHPTGRAGD